MSTDALTALLTLIDRYGLPIVVLLGVAFLVWRGVLRFGNDVDKLVAQLQAQLAYTEARRVEEREGRLELSKRLEANSETLRQATDAFSDANQIMKALMAERTQAAKA